MGAPTVGFQPVIAPVREAKMKTDAAVFVPSVTDNSVELPLDMTGWFGLNTWPVGDPPGMVTLHGAPIGVPLTSPMYSALAPPPLDESQKPPPWSLREIPQALFGAGSWGAARREGGGAADTGWAPARPRPGRRPPRGARRGGGGRRGAGGRRGPGRGGGGPGGSLPGPGGGPPRRPAQ